MSDNDDAVVTSGSLAYLVLCDETTEQAHQFLCVSDTFSGGPSTEFAEARLCDKSEMVLPLVVRARPFRSRFASLADGTPISPDSLSAPQLFAFEGELDIKTLR